MAIQAKLTSLSSEGTAFVRKSPRKTSNSLINANFKGSSPRQAPSYRGAIRSCHVRTLPWRGLGRVPMQVRTHLRIDTSTRLSLESVLFVATVTCAPSAIED
ncbi:hypothetical protein CDL15_Pgr023690 [Punica granatum]|nr:hypothetical protein CDL15_Pgr023690 [Punica granatum]